MVTLKSGVSRLAPGTSNRRNIGELGDYRGCSSDLLDEIRSTATNQLAYIPKE
jgi:hypothetical protein